MKFILPIFVSIGIFLLAFLLRSNEFRNRAPFDWDQHRDYGQVVEIVNGEYVPLGPVAKGVGGFYLGSLYYYLLVPAYTLMGGDLGALPLTSIVLDSLAAAAIFLLFRTIWGTKKSLLLAIIWACSWAAIDSSRTSWNVALIPLWSVATLFVFTHLLSSQSRLKSKYFSLLALLFGLSFHIHVSVIPLIPLLFMLNFRSFRFPVSTWAQGALIAIIPLLPLIIYDLTHNLENLRLARMLIAYQNSFKIPFPEMLSMATLKLGKVFAGFLTSRAADNLILGAILIIVSAFYALKSKKPLVRLAASTVLLSYLLVLALHDYGFPEYYFAAGFIPMLIVAVDLFRHLTKPALLTAATLSIFLNLRAYTTAPTPYSLGVKEQVVQILAAYKTPLDIRYQLNPGRDGGLDYLVVRAGITRDPDSATRVLVADDLKSPLYIDGEHCREKSIIGGLRVAEHIVQ